MLCLPSFFRSIPFQLADGLILSVNSSGEGQVILDSAYAFFQGFFPPSTYSNTTLADGSVVTSPLNGYTYVPVESVDPDEDASFDGWTECPEFTTRNALVCESSLSFRRFLWFTNHELTSEDNSTGFLAKETESKSFLGTLKPLVGDRNVTLRNMWSEILTLVVTGMLFLSL